MATSKSSSSTNRGRVRVTDKKPLRKKPLTRSPAVAEAEISKLRRGREVLESTPTEADTSIRASLI